MTGIVNLSLGTYASRDLKQNADPEEESAGDKCENYNEYEGSFEMVERKSQS